MIRGTHRHDLIGQGGGHEGGAQKEGSEKSEDTGRASAQDAHRNDPEDEEGKMDAQWGRAST